MSMEGPPRMDIYDVIILSGIVALYGLSAMAFALSGYKLAEFAGLPRIPLACLLGVLGPCVMFFGRNQR